MPGIALKNMKQETKQWISSLLLLVTLIVNGLGAFGLINGLSQKEVSDMYPTLITPSPSTFSIWSVIYSLLIASIVIITIRRKRSYYASAIDRISVLFWLSCILNMAWIVSFSFNQIGLSSILIFAFAVNLTLIVKQIGKIHSPERWLLPVTFGMYSGWLFIATVVNISAWLVKVQWSQFGISPQIWGALILLIAVGLTLLVMLSTTNAVFPLPIAWAYLGIYNSLVALESSGVKYGLMKGVSLVGVVLLIGIAAVQFYRNRYSIMSVQKAGK